MADLPGFEPGSSASKADRIILVTPQVHYVLNSEPIINPLVYTS